MRAFRLPRLRKRLWGSVAVIAAPAAVAAPMLSSVHPVLGGGAVGLAFAGVGLVIDRRIGRPLSATERGAGIIAASNPGHQLELNARHWLGRLPETIEQLGGTVARSRREMEEAASAWTTRIEARKARLETILREIREGVVVCGTDGRINLYNRTARVLLDGEPALGLGRNINEVLNDGPLRHALGLIEPAANATGSADTELVCATTSGERLLRCRVARLITDDPGTDGFVMTLTDVSRQTRAALRREQSLRAAVESLRDPLTSLYTVSESLRLAQQADLDADADRFGRMVREETHRLTEAFAHLSDETTSMVTDNWRLEDLHLGSLIAGIKKNRQSTGMPRIQCGADVWVSAEPYLLSQVIEALLIRLAGALGVSAVAITGREQGSLVYLDINWSGDVIAPDQLDEWLDAGLDDVGGTVSLREVLQRHDTTAWSQADLSRPGRAVLRLPLPGAPAKTESPSIIAPRPEFYDFAADETDPVLALGDQADRRLTELDYVVFDCETTGLAPGQGDEIVSIGAVRIHEGRVMHGETFELLANPERSIPALATSIHGIRDEDVADAPPVEEAIRRFHAFAGDAVLVGFNIAFDMRFLRLKQRRCGVRFDNPTLDALLLSILLHDHTGEHTLEGVARRLGVGVGGRHTALGDSLTTAEILIQLFGLLPDAGITRLSEAVSAQEKMVEFRRQQRAF
ncbi:3'-5' exonuclease [Spiribacter vilamensis]|uniref:DNA-directed DNA polymerase n=1 Tax=Spiribacter vilamensis TaxID=531306 RepID=A0A4Q8D0L1_9GAMM|nr:exonuclease domain-containing protein [Spiribacter vilamensis]RZU98849.1 DNA polymerase-3 subunit epsilon [Spiribacter vilamensis]TVO62133.1 histidine kinase [Spiribacter vilamensis]